MTSNSVTLARAGDDFNPHYCPFSASREVSHFRFGSIASFWKPANHFRSTPSTDMVSPARLVRFVPTEVSGPYSITSSARASKRRRIL